MNLDELADSVGEITRVGAASGNPEICDVVIDSRDVEPGSLFVALPGSQVDGHDFVSSAVEAGAAAVLVESNRLDECQAPCPRLHTADTRAALGPLSAAFFGYPARDLRIVGITGTNGKTTTAHLVQSVLEASGASVGMIGTVGYRWGDVEIDGPNTTPESLVLQRLFARMRDDGVDWVVMEVSSHALATHRMGGTDIDCALFTNLSQDHLDFHGDMASYRAVKERLFRHVLAESRRTKAPVSAVLNVDDPVGAELAGDLVDLSDIDVVGFTVEGRGGDVVARVTDRSLDETKIALDWSNETIAVRTRLLGEFNVSNCAAAAAVGLANGISAESVGRGLEDAERIPGRLERVADADAEGPAVFVDYAHTPDALRRVLATLRPLTPGRLIVVFGCGGDRDKDKRPRMGAAAEAGADWVVVTSDNPRGEVPAAIIDDALGGIDRTPVEGRGALLDGPTGVWVEEDRGAAIEAAVRQAVDRDVIVIAGKGHEQYQEIDGRRRAFDDRRRAAEALQKRAGDR